MKRKAQTPTDDGSEYEAAIPEQHTPSASESSSVHGARSMLISFAGKRRNLSGSDKVAKKAARMERNRRAFTLKKSYDSRSSS